MTNTKQFSMEPTRQLKLKKPGDLAVHPKVALTPELTEDAPEWAAILGMTQDRGEILTPLFITPEDEVLDGRHRLKAARACKLKAVPCLVIEDEDDQARIILDSICARRHYTKSARAYLALPLIEDAVAEGIARRASSLKVGDKSPKTNSVGLRDKNGSDELALKLGINPEYIRLAKNTAEAFKRSDAALEKWLLAHPPEARRWEAWKLEAGESWQGWRGARLTDMGENPDDPSTVALIPESYREIYEALLFEGDMGLGAINKAVGGALATKGQPRPDLDGADSQLFRTLKSKVASFTKTMWARWADVPPPARAEVCVKLAESVRSWPEDVRRVVLSNLTADSPTAAPTLPKKR